MQEPTNHGPDCHIAALSYLKRGWSVIPIRAGGKIPLVPWQPFFL